MKAKTLISLALVALTLTITPGCAILKQDATLDQKAAEVKALCYAASAVGTSAALEENPETRQKFELAYASLNSVVEAKIVTGLILRDIVQSLPVDELQSPTARIAIDAATMLYITAVGDRVNIEQVPIVLSAATGIRDGMKLALGK